jgi:hypothetical protein
LKSQKIVLLKGVRAPTPRRLASVRGALGVGANRVFSIRMTEGVKPLISLNRFGHFLADFGQFRVFDGQKAVVILVKL